ncbi:hypothetical protein ACHWQZ_G003399 [Mnemiopsis leidyi]
MSGPAAVKGAGGDWTSPLFGCFDDIGTCIITWFVPCVTIGQNAEASGVASCVGGAVLSLIPIVNLICMVKIRGAIREKYNIEGSPIKDCLLICFCGLCTITQEARELKVRSAGGAMPRI